VKKNFVLLSAAANIYQGEIPVTEVIREREIKILEFTKIKEDLAALTVSPLAARIALNIKPTADSLLLKKWLRQTADARLLSARNAFSPWSVEDINPYQVRAGKGAILSGLELSKIFYFLKAAGRWLHFFKDQEQSELYPSLAELAELINPCFDLVSQLERSVDEEGQLLDSASAELSRIRSKKIVLQNKIRDKMDDYIRSNNYRKYLQEALVTIRNGRYVLPVRQEYRQQLDGVVHDQSASGATLFIEPLPVVRMQNDLVALQRMEEKESERILHHLSALVADYGEDLTQSYSLYGELDFIVAKGRLSLKMGANEPEMMPENEQRLIFINAVHPLLPGEKVPLNLDIGEPVQTLVITGPNTGGKTVSLKTIGLLTIMFQSGLHIPAGRESRISVFKQIRADIGDEQSISQSLSTFSGHMKNIIEILESTTSGALVLFDELGAGTDPSEGSALAMAILAALTAKNALTVATTHINELKLFAQVQDKMQNASMEFDPDSLAPTYRLLQGVPGQSNALYIAEQLGLEQGLLQKAKSFLHRSHDQVESVIASLVEDQQRYHRDSRQAALERSRAELVSAELDQERELLKARKDDIIKEARDEARRLIRNTKNSLEQITKDLKEIKQQNTADFDTAIGKVRQELGGIRREVDAGEDTSYVGEEMTAQVLEIRDRVYIPGIKQEGEVISFNEEEAIVQIGSMKVNIALRELRKIRSKEVLNGNKEKQVSAGGYTVQKDLMITSSIDLRGLNFEEARPQVDKMLDNALWAGLSQVDLIHGKGTGKLKEGLRGYLKEHPLVKTFRSGGPSEGGEGVTVVEIKA
jgi:DNA mismatch repair protein MutS2